MGFKYDVGDEVVVREDISDEGVDYYMEDAGRDGSRRHVIAVSSMAKLRGQTVTIEKIYDAPHDWRDGMYKIVGDDDHVWTDEMFSGLATPACEYEQLMGIEALFS